MKLFPFDPADLDVIKKRIAINILKRGRTRNEVKAVRSINFKTFNVVERALIRCITDNIDLNWQVFISKRQTIS